MLEQRPCAARWRWRLRVARAARPAARRGRAAWAAPTLATAAHLASGPISVYSREDGSGTRGAFVELLGIEQADANGDKVDMTTSTAAITNSTAVMMTSVAGDPNAIGYISLGSLDDTVKAVSIDGVAPTADGCEGRHLRHLPGPSTW